MTGPEHYTHAEQLLDMAGDDEPGSDVERYRVAAAQVHATLALAAATADQAVMRWIGDEARTDREWTKAIT